MKKVDVQKPFFEMVEGVLKPLGYEKRKTREGFEYICFRDGGFVGIVPFINQYSTLFYVSLSFQLRIDKVSDVLIVINNVSDEFKSKYSTLSFGIDSLVGLEENRIKVENPEELSRALERLREVITYRALPFFSEINSVADLDKEINRDPRPKDLYCSDISVRPFVGLTCAWFGRNSQVDFWEDYYREKLTKANQFLKDQFENLVSYLKANYPVST